MFNVFNITKMYRDHLIAISLRVFISLYQIRNLIFIKKNSFKKDFLTNAATSTISLKTKDKDLSRAQKKL